MQECYRNLEVRVIRCYKNYELKNKKNKIRIITEIFSLMSMIFSYTEVMFAVRLPEKY